MTDIAATSETDCENNAEHTTTTASSSHESSPLLDSFSASTDTPRGRLESIFANALLFQEQAYRSPFRISHSCESKRFYFSPEPTQDCILCSCIAVFNMAITVHAMDGATALANRIEDRHRKVKGLFAHCLQLLSLLLDPMPVLPARDSSSQGPSPASPPRTRHEDRKNVVLELSSSPAPSPSCSESSTPPLCSSTLNAVTLATCDLLGMACLNNLIVMNIDSELPTECSPARTLHLEALLHAITSVRGERYGQDRDVMAVMARLADMFLITVFFLLKFPPGPGAAAA